MIDSGIIHHEFNQNAGQAPPFPVQDRCCQGRGKPRPYPVSVRLSRACGGKTRWVRPTPIAGRGAACRAPWARTHPSVGGGASPAPTRCRSVCHAPAAEMHDGSVRRRFPVGARLAAPLGPEPILRSGAGQAPPVAGPVPDHMNPRRRAVGAGRGPPVIHSNNRHRFGRGGARPAPTRPVEIHPAPSAADCICSPIAAVMG